jgi:ferric-dicitrate binding protein FerR (iron transport regulator)
VHTVRFKGPKPRRRRRRRKRELRQSQYERNWGAVLEQQRIHAGVQIAQAHAFGEYQRTERRRMWIQVGLVVLVAGGLVWLWWRQDRS